MGSRDEGGKRALRDRLICDVTFSAVAMGHLTRATVMEGFRERSLGCATIMLCILGAAHAFVPSFLRPESFSMRSNRYMLSLDTRSALDFDGRAERRPWPASTRLHGRRSCNERRVLRMLDASEAEKDPQLIVAFLMKSLQLNDFPEIDSGSMPPAEQRTTRCQELT